MEKLTLENIAPYLPYGLKIDTRKGVLELHTLHSNNKWGAWFTMDCLSKNKSEIENHKNFVGEPPLGKGFKLKEIKPILRPMDLTKPIQVDGKEIIPIVELASLVIPHVTWELHKGSDRVINEVGRGFCYDKPTKSFQYWEYYDWLNVPNQLALFQWLFKHKLDVFNLIERGLAIDVNTLEINPYKSC